MRRHRERARAPGENLPGVPGYAGAQLGGGRVVGDRDELRLVPAHLLGEELDVPSRGERDRAESIREALDQRQRRYADRSGRAEEGERAVARHSAHALDASASRTDAAVSARARKRPSAISGK